MAWTQPRTWVFKELTTSTIMNTHVRDNLIALYERPMATAYYLLAANMGTTGAAWATASTASAAISLTPNTTRVKVEADFFGSVANQNSGACWTISDGAMHLGDSASGQIIQPGNSNFPIHICGIFTGLSTGVSHTFYICVRAKAAASYSAAISGGHSVVMVAHEI